MSLPTDNAPAAPSAGATEESRSSLAALLLDPSFWADWASVVGLVGLVILFGVTSPVFLSIANLQGYDSGLLAYTSSQPGIKTAKGGATKFCISADDSGHYAHMVGPGGQVIYKETTDYCATWTAS